MGKRDGQGDGGVVQDPRFSAMHKDPRFSRFPKTKSTVEIDKRFSGMFSDPDFETKSAVDKRGRKVKESKRSEDMKRYYHLKDEEKWKADAEGDGKSLEGDAAGAGAPAKKPTATKAQRMADAKDKKTQQLDPVIELKDKQVGDEQEEKKEEEEEQEEEQEEEDSPAEEDEDAVARQRFLRARGMIDETSSDDDEDSVDDAEGLGEAGLDDGSAAAAAAAAEWGVGAMAANPEEDIPLTDESRRIAIVDLDWDHVKAVDILAVLRSFAPKGGEVTRVTVYPSDYGLERMAEEAAMGPKQIFKGAEANSTAPLKQQSREDEDADEDEDEETNEVDKKRLAMYEKSKLRYHYAVAECDTVATAALVYTECDGLEFERSACKFDLRFIPDEQSFKGRQVRDTATSVPSEYEPPTVFNLSLQHTEPKLSWDADDDSRKRVLHKKLTEAQIKEADFQAYLGSDDEEDQEGAGPEEKDAEKIRERYRALLLGGGVSNAGDASAGGGNEDDDDEDDEEEEKKKKKAGAKGSKVGAHVKRSDGMEMEVTFVSGLEHLGEKMLAKKKEDRARAGETVWDAYLRKRKEKRKERKHGRRLGRGGEDGDSSDSEEYDAIEDGPGRPKVKSTEQSNEEDPFDDPFFKDDDAGVAVSSGEEDEDEEDDAGPGPGSKARGKVGKLQSEKEGKGKVTKEQRKKDKEDERRRQAELELLLMDDAALREAAVRGMPQAVKSAAAGASGREDDDQDEEGGAQKKKQSRKERLRLKKLQRRAAREGSDDEDAAVGGGGVDGEAGQAGFNVNLSDPRFSGLFEDHSFALDPTDPRFAKAKGVEVVAKEVAKRRSKTVSTSSVVPASKQLQAEAAPQANKDSSHQNLELRAMVAKLKRKAVGPEVASKRSK